MSTRVSDLLLSRCDERCLAAVVEAVGMWAALFRCPSEASCRQPARRARLRRPAQDRHRRAVGERLLRAPAGRRDPSTHACCWRIPRRPVMSKLGGRPAAYAVGQHRGERQAGELAALVGEDLRPPKCYK